MRSWRLRRACSSLHYHLFGKQGQGLGQVLYDACRELVKLCRPVADALNEGIIGAIFTQCVTNGDGGSFWERIDMEVAPTSQKASFLTLQVAMSRPGWYEVGCVPKLQLICV